ncbi:uncharacterized protein LOC124196262 isoform X1 [Daphnia pulex]|uniref:uncharacterized protein LOC124196262 isoform X1 n=1 Tax=Daphnia pulex TaxID=6669 RepID=UPI001EDDA251|nr:uncharacterized protein LOC124196262 isoform X1 [Daphnia pulex]
MDDTTYSTASKASLSNSVANAQHTPNVKPFNQKSFSESKTASNGSVQINRSVSSVSVIRSSSLTLPRWSVTSSLLGNDSSSRSVWDVSKEPYKKERVQQLLDKRGWSVVSFRHWRSLGHQMQDLKVPEEKSASVKSIQTGRSDVPSTVEGSVCASPTLLKRKSSVMNTNFEKEDEDEQCVLTPPPQPDFENDQEEAAALQPIRRAIHQF